MALLLLLVGATVIVGVNLDDSADVVMLQSQTHLLQLNRGQEITSDNPAVSHSQGAPSQVRCVTRSSSDIFPILRC